MVNTLIDDVLTAANVPLAVHDTIEKVRGLSGSNSLSQFSKLTQVEPIAVVSRDLLALDYMPDVMQSVLSIFSAYYIQAVNLLSAVNSVKVIKTLDALNPDRDAMGWLLTQGNVVKQAQESLFEEAYKYKLPSFSRISTEDDSKGSKNKDTTVDFKNKDNATIQKQAAITEAANLAVGKVISVSFGKDTKEGKSFTVDVRVRLAPAILGAEAVEKIIAFKTDDTSFMERFHAWRSGRIEFIQDLVFCQDLIDAHKKALMQDEQGVYSEIIRRANNSKKYGLLSKNVSLATASNIFVISEEVAHTVERKFGGRLDKKHVLDMAFENTYGMMIVVVDREWERVNFYTRGIAASSDFSIKEIKAANKGKGIDIQDVFKMLAAGNAPSF